MSNVSLMEANLATWIRRWKDKEFPELTDKDSPPRWRCCPRCGEPKSPAFLHCEDCRAIWAVPFGTPLELNNETAKEVHRRQVQIMVQ